MFDGRWRTLVERGVAPVGSRLGSRRVKPDHLTIAGLVMAAACAVVIASGRLFLGLLLLILSAVPDLLDGAVAKATGSASVRGAFFDSVSDRVTDALILLGIGWHLAGSQHRHAAMLPFAVLATSTLISYERAKAESLGFSAKGGLMERAERIIALCIGLAFPGMLVPVLWVMLVLTTCTAIGRFRKVWRQAPGPAGLAGTRSHGLGAARLARRGAAAGWRGWREGSTTRPALFADGRWRGRRRVTTSSRRRVSAELWRRERPSR